jgi:hypothetical protein
MSVDTVFELFRPSCYQTRLRPAVETFQRNHQVGPLVKLLRAGQERVKRDEVVRNQNLLATDGLLQSSIDILEGREFYGPESNHVPPTPGARTNAKDLRSYVEGMVYYEIFDVLCIAYTKNVPASQILTRGRLLWYLYEHSSFLERAFTGGLHGVSLEILPEKELLDRKDLEEILDHLTLVPIPDDEAEREKERKKLEAAKRSGKIAIFRSDADPAAIYGDPVSKQLSDFKHLLEYALSGRDLAIAQMYR